MPQSDPSDCGFPTTTEKASQPTPPSSEPKIDIATGIPFRRDIVQNPAITRPLVNT
ncbi:hypothetical protein RSSM_00600 [Rhodopirellula sallentina SM41]|uniref:Uncharacterized protein n=1 Tax=Rhodopirellula sallentina SM41 TaxID=1263870 RepID=M5U948_9BACT|nr:hypothetical protein RSSM_00600 [Rhodopirellula sallentina SM41]